jgi:hypothetical protein
MGVDIRDDVKTVSDQITTYQQYREFKESYDDLKKVAGDNYEDNKKFLSEVLNKVDRKKRKQDSTCTPFLEHLIKQLKKLDGSGDDTNKFVKKLYINALKDTKKGLVELLVKLAKEFLNCGDNQTYQVNSTFYVPVDQIDLFGMLQKSPTDEIGKFFYEPKEEDYPLYLSNPVDNPYSMNRELYNRIQNMNQPFAVQNNNNFYIGTSQQNLFDISYVESYTDPVTTLLKQGSFFKIDLAPRSTFPTIDEFLNDYYSSINILEYKTFFAYLLDFSTGVLNFGANAGKSKLEVLQKTMALNQRLSCLCSDTTKEISVGGNAKISELEDINDSFFELSDVELRIIEQNVSNIKLGVIEFEDCNNIQVPLNLQASIDALDQLKFNEDTNNPDEINDALGILYPATSESFKGSLDMSFLKQFINALMATVLSPKAILPFMTMVYATNQKVPQEPNFNIEKFAKNFRTYFVKFITGLVARLTEKVFKLLKKQIIKLVSFIRKNLSEEKRENTQKMILAIVSLIAAPINFVLDFRECKSCLNDLLGVLNLAISAAKTKAAAKPGGEIPLPLLLASKALDGYSATRAFMNVVQDLEAIGVPTGPMPDGSPNKFVASIFSILKGQQKEMAENGKVAIGVGPLTSLPTGITIPNDAYGKVI